ncbi:exosome non-catalytic core subunit CSL4 ASCRUDRAFT_31968 [Ascoidea rubescens DSM 1968]|uniref:Uncharacterized protein n=1 Tax=Ascoidea rubescens DSM 1968 TaxID=1344418 RepID=A0A1D2VM66_9ASCO|nr:hypothetical protein ASCRUDRAFT_31968 [Ascoidea rubescens DSM 1968]ODV62708.1 hypothetical protein ASCRUDRAFT_31968 [Ascoidea rubescens DSM 1968]
MTIQIPGYVVPGQALCPTYEAFESRTVRKFISGPGTKYDSISIGNNERSPIIASTILGKVRLQPLADNVDDPSANDENKYDKNNAGASKTQNVDFQIKKYLISVLPKNNVFNRIPRVINEVLSEKLNLFSSNLPHEGDIVLVKISKISIRQAFCEILVVERGNQFQQTVLKDSGIASNGYGEISPGGGSGALTSILATASSASVSSSSLNLGENFKGVIRSQDVRDMDKDKVQINDCFMPGDIVRALVLSLGDGSNYYLSTTRNDLGVVLARASDGSNNLLYPIDWQTMIDPITGLTEKRKCAKPF